ncbi:MAG: histidine kinase [Bacteroidota bacterium]
MRFGNSRYWLFQLSGWGLFAFIYLFFAFLFDRLEWKFTNRLLIFVGLGLLLTHIMRWVIQRTNILMKPLKSQIISLILITVIFTFLLSASETYMQELSGLAQIDRSTKEVISVFKRILDNAFHSSVYLFIWNSIYFIYHYIEKSRRQQVDTLKLEALIKELELKTIKAHINPHFIFNSLNSIRALVDENPQRAREAVTELSNILRSSMSTEKMETVCFEKELDIVKDYLALENMRFEDRLKIVYQIDEDTLDQPVPPMMLQTLVENAIKHGISKQIKGGMVKIISDFKGDYHELTVQNTGSLNGYLNNEAHQNDLAEQGFGLSSTTSRLSLLYGDKARFEIKQMTETLVEAKVLLPVNFA